MMWIGGAGIGAAIGVSMGLIIGITNGDIVTVVQNELNRKQRLALVVDGQGTNTEIPAHSITTFITKNSQE